MEKCVLLKPDTPWTAAIRAFRREMLETNGSMDGTGPLRRMEDIGEWLAFNRRLEKMETVTPELVPADQFIYVREADGKIVGMIQFRRRFNDFLERYAGHIGYSVCPSERRKGYAKRMLADCLNVCRAYGLDRVLIACIPENVGSRRTILANGGEYESTVFCEPDGVYLERYWIAL